MRQGMILSWTCLGLAVLALISGYFWIGYWPSSLAGLALIISWGVGIRRNWRWVITLSMFGFSLAMAAGAWLGIGHGWLVLCMLFLLAAWDLQWFAWRLNTAEQIEGEKEIVLFHIQRLSITLGIGLLLAAIAVSVQVRYSFGLAVILSLLAILGIRQWILMARRSKNRPGDYSKDAR